MKYKLLWKYFYRIMRGGYMTWTFYSKVQRKKASIFNFNYPLY